MPTRKDNPSMAEQFPSDTLREIADRARLALGADRALVLPLAGGEPLPPGPEGGPSLSAPIRIDGDPVATLVVSRDPGGAPFGEESALLSTVCELAAHAIAASRRADLRTEQLTLVQAVASAVGARDRRRRGVPDGGDRGVRAHPLLRRHGHDGRPRGQAADRRRRPGRRRRDRRSRSAAISTPGSSARASASSTQLVLAEATADPRYSWSADGRWESLLLTPVDGRGPLRGRARARRHRAATGSTPPTPR